MSAQVQSKRISVPQIRARKGGEPIVCLTCYHAHTARLLDEHVDLMLVGDSLGMVIHGLETTLGVTMEMMILHGQAVMRGAKKALVVVDMPFGSYEESPQLAFKNAARILAETGCQAVKLEGGVAMAETVAYLTSRGIPVMGHIGLTPQRIQIFGGFKTQGRTEAEWPAIEADAKAIAEAGAFALTLEGMAEPLAAKITKEITIPTIGIGASPLCDGQILVMEDMLGLNPTPPKFVRQYAEMGADIEAAVKAYAADVRARTFPGKENVYPMKKAG
ncbi:3-methyl-2-oxobutanoate hydroxymethyltransferase [Rhizomicrobium palustre]|uniref:3-methyl-2-oxobutanoate hydroxymethyltransferase n=1 Tax=Rhizomicrobium palustre TaxID=189966 RepID=A0A846MUE9_9PROT|nr:3-methyl-2-oxobutanoate hydroxymethyltransferase [Rhizomicrobium palustre]NIK87064.1 3-methyl-2-oxobutanoate hydroxymethyltransferase [Rhizomicrobium palustre]